MKANAFYVMVTGIGAFFCVYVMWSDICNKGAVNVEYELEILNQNKVKIQAVGSGKIYIVPIDSVGETLILDNL